MILIRRSSAFGDVLWSEPVVRYFLNKNKKVKVFTDYPEVFNNYPSSNLYIDKKLKNIDRSISLVGTKLGLKPYVIDLNKAYEKRPKMHVLKAYFEVAGIKDEPLSYPKLYLSEQEKINRFDKPYAVLHIEKNRLNFRNVYGVDWAEIVHYLKQQGLEIIQLSASGEDIYGNWVKTPSLRDVMSIIYNCRIFVGFNSGPSHIADSFGKLCVLFFGAVNQKYWHLDSFKGKFLKQDCEFANCYHEVTGSEGQVCKLVGSTGIPKCSVHKTETVIETISNVLAMQ